MILITGSSGFVGSNLIKQLMQKRKKFYGVDIKKSKYINFKNFTKLDLSDSKKVLQLFKKIKPKIVIHLAAISGVKVCHDNKNLAFKNNVETTFNVLMASKELKCKNVLIASSFAVEKFLSNPSFYAYTKKTCEDMIKIFKKYYKLNVAAMRFSNVFGPYSKHKSSAIHQMIKCLLNGKVFKIHGTGKQRRDFIYVGDLIKKINSICKNQHKKDSYNVNMSKTNSVKDIINTLNELHNKKLKTKYVKPPPGYDVSFSGKFKETKNQNLILNLKKTINWYNSKKI